MATLVQNAVRIKQTFDDIYDAIVEKGVTPSGGVDTYPSAIDNIPQQAIVSPETCPFKLVFSSFAHTNTYQVNFNTNDVLDETYFIKSDTNKWKCVKSGIYYIFLSIGIHAETVPSGYEAKTQYYLNSTLFNTARMTSPGIGYAYSISNMSSNNEIIGNIYSSKTGNEISGRIKIYYWGDV